MMRRCCGVRTLMTAWLAITLTCASSVGRAQDERAAPPERVVSLAPNLTEIVYALGEEERLVGVTPYCRFPPEAREKPKVGALVNMDYERLLQLEPDLVALLPGQAEVEGKLQKLGIASLTIRTESIADIYAAIETMGVTLGAERRAARLVEEIRGQLKAVRERCDELNDTLSHDGGAPTALFAVGRNPGTLQQIYACAPGSFLHELMTIVGLENIMGASDVPWPVVSKEYIVEADPDIILDGSIRSGDAPIDGDAHMKAWRRLSTLTAVKEGRVIAVGEEHLTIPGPWIGEGAEYLARLVYGEAFDAEQPTAR